MADMFDTRSAKDRSSGNAARRRGAVLVVGAGLTVAVAFALWHQPRAAPPTSLVTADPTRVPSTAAPSPVLLTVHVSGAVSEPGLVSLPDGSRVADAVVAAGGALPSGDLANINLAAPVADGMYLAVPWIGDGPGDRVFPEETTSRSFPVDVNRAGVDQLTELPGVGEVLATRIVTHRDAHGPFKVLEDLLDVPGIGEGKLADLRDYAAVSR